MHTSDNIIFAGHVELKELIHKYIGETEKNLILCDSNTEKYCLPVIKKLLPGISDDQLILMDAGDGEKNITNLHHIWSKLQFQGADRSNCLINLGGGMITDIGGFAASTYKRGITFVNIPTSLLGMVDAAIGGKTAINLSKVKNEIGTFSRAGAVIIYPPFLKTLPEEEMLAGLAEILKTALTFNKTLFQKLLKIKSVSDIHEDIIRTTATIKQEITHRDFHDRAERQCLNFGHTIGHALEALYFSRGQTLKHGYAVAAGMICEAYISFQLSRLPEKELKQIETYILKSFPDVSFGMEEINGLIELMRHDKKNFDSDIRMSLIRGIGICSFGVSCKEEIIRNSLQHYLKITAA